MHANYSLDDQKAFMPQVEVWKRYQEWCERASAPPVSAKDLIGLEDPRFRPAMIPGPDGQASKFVLEGMMLKSGGVTFNPWFLQWLLTNYERQPVDEPRSSHVSYASIWDSWGLKTLPFPDRAQKDCDPSTYDYFYYSLLGLPTRTFASYSNAWDLLPLRKKARGGVLLIPIPEVDAEVEAVDSSKNASKKKRSISSIVPDGGEAPETEMETSSKRRRDSGYYSASESTSSPSAAPNASTSSLSTEKERPTPFSYTSSFLPPRSYVAASTKSLSPPSQALEDAVNKFIDHMVTTDPIRATAYEEARELLVDSMLTPDLIPELGVEGLERLGLTTGVALKVVIALKTYR